jgi:hypothetical protein
MMAIVSDVRDSRSTSARVQMYARPPADSLRRYATGGEISRLTDQRSAPIRTSAHVCRPQASFLRPGEQSGWR